MTPLLRSNAVISVIGAWMVPADEAVDRRSRAGHGKLEVGMDWEQAKANWNEFREQVLDRWEELTDDQLDEIRGDRAILVGKLQEAYGIDKKEAEEQVRDFEKAH